MDHPPVKVRRIEVGSKRPFYLIWPPDGREPVKLCNGKSVQEFLEREGLSGVVALNSFNFKKSSAEEKTGCISTNRAVGAVPLSDVFRDDEDVVEADVEPAGHGLQDRVRPRGHRHGQEGASEE